MNAEIARNALIERMNIAKARNDIDDVSLFRCVLGFLAEYIELTRNKDEEKDYEDADELFRQALERTERKWRNDKTH